MYETTYLKYLRNIFVFYGDANTESIFFFIRITSQKENDNFQQRGIYTMQEEKSFEIWETYGIENFDEMVDLFAAFLDDTETAQAEQLPKWVKKHIQPIDFSTAYAYDYDTAYDFYDVLFAEGVPFEAWTLKSFLANFDVDTEGEWAEFADYFDTKYGWSVYEISPSEKAKYIEELETDEDFDMWYESLCGCADDSED